MNETIEFIKERLDANNGEVTYQALLDETPYQYRQHLPQALRSLKAQGIAQRQNVFDAASGTVTLFVRKNQGE